MLCDLGLAAQPNQYTYRITALGNSYLETLREFAELLRSINPRQVNRISPLFSRTYLLGLTGQIVRRARQVRARACWRGAPAESGRVSRVGVKPRISCRSALTINVAFGPFRGA